MEFVTRSIITTLVFLAALSSTCNAVAIDLPRGVRSEGVTHLAGSNFLASDVFTGNIYLIDVYSQLITSAVRAPPGRLSAGIWGTKAHIFAAGTGARGGTPAKAEMYVYDTVTGAPIANCQAPNGSFVNDVVANHRYAYFSDSGRAQIYRMKLNSLPQCDITVIPLRPASLFDDNPNAFYSNGIHTFYSQGLLLANTAQQTIYFVDAKRDFKVTEVLYDGPVDSLPGVDGIERVYNTLYVTQNRLNKISVWKLMFNGSTRRVTLKFVKDITRPGEFGTPTTVAVSKNRLVAANFNLTAPLRIPAVDTFTVSFVRL